MRTVMIPAAIVTELREHLSAYVAADATALVFTGRLGGVLRGGISGVTQVGMRLSATSAFRACTSTICGIPATLWPAGRASLADLKARMGHDSARAAIIYQHATAAADRVIADVLDRQIEASGHSEWHANGTSAPATDLG